ncbi:MAG: class I SAM-dependent methyltransferase [Chitinophagaceae bacterium]|nr:class I SAM-dependent methyltransferase [Chitinophagaceae bacterium]
MMTNINRHPASFRDPSGYVYEKDGIIYRFVSNVYKANYELLQSSGLFKQLSEKKLLLPFTELKENHTGSTDWLITLQPQPIPFLNYAWEWCFDALKDAALTTLSICKLALQKEMILKDATHFNIQLVNGRPLLIDTLSLEQYNEGSSWVAYRQFCECFLNPLLLHVYCGLECQKMLLAYPQGIPVTLTSSLLPLKSKLNTAVMLHVHLHAKLSGGKKKENTTKQKKISKQSVLHILNSLESFISKLQLPETKSAWSNYYDETILSADYLLSKKQIVEEWLNELSCSSVIDIGANEGEFSLLFQKDAMVVSTDVDSNCINKLYSKVRREKLHHLLPLVTDLTQPSPAMGWLNKEQLPFFERKKFDLCLALALVHHLAIGKNIPFSKLASFFAEQCETLLIEFVPKSDPKVVEMLAEREDIFEDYFIDLFELEFTKYFIIQKKQLISNTKRILYQLKKPG